MADEKILKDEILKDEDETYGDGNELFKRGLLSESDALSSSAVRNKLHSLGYTGYEDKGGIMNGNIYKDKQGKVVTRDEFWKIFDADNK